jgi:hypothetical protein
MSVTDPNQGVTMSSQDSPTGGDMFAEVMDLVTGLGVMLMPLLIMAIPCLILLLPLALPAIPLALLAAPVLLIRSVRRVSR